VVVVGGGVGGLALAIRLATAGHDVDLFERNPVVGGKLASRCRDGYTFDIGPSLITLPHVFDELFRVAGTTLAAEVDLVRLDPQFRYHWSDGSELEVFDDATATGESFDRFGAGAGDAWRAFDRRGRRIWDVAERTFFAGPMSDPWALVKRLRSPLDLTAIDPFRSLDRSARAHFDDERLIQWAGRYATYSGSSPFHAPATLACIPHLEARFGCWYARGGLDTLRQALQRVAERVGVAISTDAEVASITTASGRVAGVELADGTRHDADVVVANTDAEVLYSELLDDRVALRKVRRAKRSMSGFAMCIGVRGLTPSIAHHNVWFSHDSPAEFTAIDHGELAADPTVYACVSSVTDATQAPDGCENWFVLVNTPPGVEVDADAYGRLVLDRLAVHGVSLDGRIEFVESMSPHDIQQRYGAPGGAIYGTSSDGMRAAFRRPANRGSVAGLYLVGGSSHPGGGLPLVVSSARIVADMVANDLAS
jgi:phytoene desaturase